MLLKLLGFGFREYVRDHHNIFDAIIVLVSLVEAVLTPMLHGQDISFLSLLRAFRAIRMLKLVRYNPAMTKMLE